MFGRKKKIKQWEIDKGIQIEESKKYFLVFQGWEVTFFSDSPKFYFYNSANGLSGKAPKRDLIILKLLLEKLETANWFEEIEKENK